MSDVWNFWLQDRRLLRIELYCKLMPDYQERSKDCKNYRGDVALEEEGKSIAKGHGCWINIFSNSALECAGANLLASVSTNECR